MRSRPLRYQQMDEDIELSKNEIEELVGVISSAISDLSSLRRADAKATKIKFIEDRIERIKIAFRTFRVELRDIPSADSEDYQKLSKKFESQIKKLSTDFQWAKKEADRTDLLGESGSAQTDTRNFSTGQVVEMANKEYDQADASVARSKKVIAETEQVGASTVNMLETQREQLSKVGQNLDEIEDSLKRADQLIRAFVRRMATDKLIMCWLFLIVAGLLAIIIYHAMK